MDPGTRCRRMVMKPMTVSSGLPQPLVSSRSNQVASTPRSILNSAVLAEMK